jgi:hypothetical protein
LYPPTAFISIFHEEGETKPIEGVHALIVGSPENSSDQLQLQDKCKLLNN